MGRAGLEGGGTQTLHFPNHFYLLVLYIFVHLFITFSECFCRFLFLFCERLLFLVFVASWVSAVIVLLSLLVLALLALVIFG